MSIQSRFEEFHRRNPAVYKELIKLVERWLAKGNGRLGIGMLWEVMRWNIFMRTVDPSSKFKLDNRYRSRYVRLMIKKRPEWSSLFELRILKTA